MTAMQSTLANVRLGRDAMFLPEQAAYAEAMRRLAMDPATPSDWIARAEGLAWFLANTDSERREKDTAESLARAAELFGEGRA
jgi:hypothetical protein